MSTTGKHVGIYVHIPFCQKKCPYCHFYVLNNKGDHKDLYLKCLDREWQNKKIHFKDKKIHTIYFGGGTPSVFPKAIEHFLSFIPNHGAKEITVEINPEDASLELIHFLKSLGINRISFGVQSLQDQELILLKRGHRKKKTIDAIWLFYKNGLTNLSIDLMYDIPNQTLSSFSKTLNLIKDLPITHLSLYNLTLEPHTSFYKQRFVLKIPEEKESLKMLEKAVLIFESLGFERYEISAFAKKGYQSKHNMGYWQGTPFLGFGPSAFSYWKQKRFRNISHLLKYHKALDKKEPYTDFEEHLEPIQRIRELLCIGLRVFEGINTPLFEKNHGKLEHETKERIDKLIYLNFLEKHENRINLTSKGILFYDTAMSILI